MANKANFLRKSIQFILALFTLSLYALGGIFYYFLPLGGIQKRKVRIYCGHLLSKVMLYCIGVEVVVQGEVDPSQGKLVVANHTSVLDLVILSAFSPSVFVTSVEIEKTPVLSFLAKTAGVIFIERRNRDRVEFDREQIRRILLQGFNVVLFPEGTSTNGSQVLRFKSGLFPAAAEIRAPIEPICLYFESRGGQPITAENEDQVYYFGDHQIQNHLFNIFTNPKVKVQLKVLPIVRSSPEADVNGLANECRDRIAEAYEMQKKSVPSQTSGVQLMPILN